MRQKSLALGFDVTMDKGATLKPLNVKFWNQEDKKKAKPSIPLKYMADALTGLSLIKLNSYIKSPIASPDIDYTFVSEAWKSLDPHVELYERSQTRVKSIQSQLSAANTKICTDFENKFIEQLEAAQKPYGIDLVQLWPILETLNWFEHKIESPLLYNFKVNFSKPFLEKLHTLYSFLLHLRGVVAVDHNAHAGDTTHEGVHMDAITDYLPRAEYIVNDALVYWNFMKLSRPFMNPKANDNRVEKLLVNPLEKIFEKYSHHATCLVDSLPQSFLNSLNPLEMEEAFYLVQMDWLLGSPAGLLFKIREEIFALQNGYEKIFWKDIEPTLHKKPVSLHVFCDISGTSIFGKKTA